MYNSWQELPGINHSEYCFFHVTARKYRFFSTLADITSMTNEAMKSSEFQEDPEITSLDELEKALWGDRPEHNEMLGTLLLENGSLTQEQLQLALEEQREHPDTQLGHILVSMGLVWQQDINQALAYKLGIPRVELKNILPEADILKEISAEIAMLYNILPIMMSNDRLVVAMENPLDLHVVEALQFHTNHRIEPVIASHEDLNWAVGNHYGSIDQTQLIEEINAENHFDFREENVATSRSTIEQEASKRPVVRLINAIILQGVLRNASDIHIRPGRDKADIYYRVDGVLQYSRTIDKSLLMPLIARIKIIGRMDIAERRRPQDGHARLFHQGKNIDLRISVMPSVKGESAVIRILDKSVGLRSLEELGFLDKDLEQLKLLLSNNHGIFLVTGPTGSGKSTSLYAMLTDIKQRGPHIITVEDPVEYDMDDVEQMQISNIIGYSFAEALRHILRHDPDVIMVGEIRDQETGHIAVKSALTGHLVMSTLHTNDAVSAVTRLIEMGIEPYLVSSTLLGVLAQRLVRKICPECKTEDKDVPDVVRKVLKLSKKERFYRGQGCKQCNHTGYHGRTTVAELLTITPEMVTMINSGASESELRELATKQGLVSLTQNGIKLARKGETTLAEIFAVRIN